MDRYKDKIGHRIGLLTFAAIAEHRGDNNRLLGIFSCDCGGSIILAAGRVLNGGKRTHCGCQTDHGSHRTHGMKGTPEYSSWGAMKSRCLNPNTKDFARYGACGVSIYPEWIESFDAFYKHVGPRPAGTSLERINTKDGYFPGNVCWADPVAQACNRTNSKAWYIQGKRFESAEFAATHFGVSDVTIHRWVKGHFDARRGTTTGPKENCFVENKY